MESANILRQIAEAVKPKESRSDSPRFSRTPQLADFVEAPDGGIDFGQITKGVGSKIKRQAAPIRLSMECINLMALIANSQSHAMPVFPTSVEVVSEEDDMPGT